MNFLLDLPSSSRPNRLYLQIIECLHASYHVAVLASTYKYVPSHLAPKGLAKRNFYQIADLRTLLRELDMLAPEFGQPPQYDEEPPSSVRDILMLRMQCLSSLIYLLSKLHPDESGYDAYSEHFERIILDGESVASMGDFCHRPFSVAAIGIMQPLFLTAVKYRHPAWRRRAIALLESCGREGPFHGPFSAAAALRLAEVEESRPSECFVAAEISELNRIHGLSMILEHSGPPGCNIARIEMSRCVDMDALRIDHTSCWETIVENIVF